MNGLLGIWLVMRVVSFALLTFILVFMVGGHGWAATGRAITFMEPGLLVESPRRIRHMCGHLAGLGHCLVALPVRQVTR
jgi:hypothetical protein